MHLSNTLCPKKSSPHISVTCSFTSLHPFHPSFFPTSLAQSIKVFISSSIILSCLVPPPGWNAKRTRPPSPNNLTFFLPPAPEVPPFVVEASFFLDLYQWVSTPKIPPPFSGGFPYMCLVFPFLTERGSIDGARCWLRTYPLIPSNI